MKVIVKTTDERVICVNVKKAEFDEHDFFVVEHAEGTDRFAKSKIVRIEEFPNED